MNDKRTLYVSNLDKKIYVIYNLPEEIIATLFAYVSRNSKSLREDILKITEEKAKDFHTKWVVNYGHASIAEMAVIHIGIEKVSRLFSSILERSNPHISFIEYSQRYQQVKRGEFYIPKILDQYPMLKENYISTQCQLYDHYIEAIQKLVDFYKSQYEKNNNSPPLENDFLGFKRKAFEDARYLLPLSFYTNLSMTTNARALEESLIKLLSSSYPEVVDTAKEIKEEALLIFPTLIKYAKSNSFLSSLEKEKEKEENKNIFLLENQSNNLEVKYIPKYSSSSINIEELLNQILIKYFYEFSSLNIKDLEINIKSKSFKEKKNIFEGIFKKYSRHDPIPKFLEYFTYTFEILISESCWHQLLRHRKIKLSYQSPTMYNGFIFPSLLEEVPQLKELKELFHLAYNKAYSLFNQLKNINMPLSHYTVLNMCRRKIICEISFADLYHLIQLRLSPNSQSEIQNLIWKFVHLLYPKYWIILDPALKILENHYSNDQKILSNLKSWKRKKKYFNLPIFYSYIYIHFSLIT